MPVTKNRKTEQQHRSSTLTESLTDCLQQHHLHINKSSREPSSFGNKSHLVSENRRLLAFMSRLAEALMSSSSLSMSEHSRHTRGRVSLRVLFDCCTVFRGVLATEGLKSPSTATYSWIIQLQYGRAVDNRDKGYLYSITSSISFSTT